MQSAAEVRSYLEWWTENGTVAELAASYPNCGGEGAEVTAGGHGPVHSDERLRYFVATRSDIDLKRKPKAAVGPAIFKRCFQSGMSTYRLQYATPDELREAARILRDHQVEQHADYGGILGVVDFVAGRVRYPLADAEDQVCCVLDTPLKGRQSHADVVSSVVPSEPEELTSLRLLLFNAVGGVSSYRAVRDITEVDFSEFLPAAAQGK